jgi:16S rRNA (cytosine967-C5)-methyltransferase
LAERRRRRPAGKQGAQGAETRRRAIDALVRIDEGGAYANLVLPRVLEDRGLSQADRRFVTELVYGTTRMRRACDHLIDRFLLGEVEPPIRAALRVGTYQLAFLRTPTHAAVSATVGAVRGRGRSVVNAVLRRVADAEMEFPDRAIELSYPDWIVERLMTDLGPERTEAALMAMNQPAESVTRDDGYVQDRASQMVVEAMGAGPGDLVLDTCAAPGGKATSLAATGATVVAGDLRPGRVRLTAGNVTRLEADVALVVADGRHQPFRPGQADKVLVDAPCSGLGSLRRRADARWRIDADAPERLAELQVDLVLAGLELLRPGGQLTYSVCTLTSAESTGVLDTVLERARNRVEATVLDPPGKPWSTDGRVAALLPGETDGMLLFRLGV